MERLKVMIVDDDDLFRLALRALLERHAQLEIVGEANDGTSAIALAAEVDPDLVLIDYEMPRMNGLEAARAVRLQSPATQVVIVSGSLERDLEARAYAAGATPVVSKDRLDDGLASALELA